MKMQNVLINNTFDIYHSASGLQHNFSVTGKEGEIATVLGWAVQRNIPFQEAFAVIVEKKHGLMSDFWSLLFRSYENRISFAIIELEKGKPLSFVLKRRLSKYLSPYYLAAVEKAEIEGKLAEILPQLAENIRFTSGVKDQFKASVIYSIVQLTTALMVFSGLFVFIIPKFQKIFAELLGDLSLPPLTQFVVGISNSFFANFIFGILKFFVSVIFIPIIILKEMKIDTFALSNPFFDSIQIAFIVIVPYLSYRFISKWYKSSSSSNKDISLYVFFTGLGIATMVMVLFLVNNGGTGVIGIIFYGILQALFILIIPYIYFKIIYGLGRFIIVNSACILVHVPFFGKQVKKIGLLELSGAMATLTGAGYDVLEAAKWNSDTVSGYWLKKRLRNFVKSVESGENWSDTWEEMHLGSPAQNWIVRNAASRENPYEGFRMLSKWLRDEINSQTNISMIFFEVFCIFFNATFIGITIFAIWQCLWKLIYYSAEF